MITKKVILKGHGVFWLPVDDEWGRGRPLIPLGQCDDQGRLNVIDGLFSDSYAHVGRDGYIRRYMEIIGHQSDLQPIDESREVLDNGQQAQ